jgi:hypothetical protein
MFNRCAFALAAFLGTVAPAAADIITVDPNTAGLGANLSNMFPGLRLANLTNGSAGGYSPIVSDVFVSGDPWGVGSLTLGASSSVDSWQACMASGTAFNCRSPWQVLELTFDTPTNSVSIAGSWRSDAPMMFAYNTLGQEIGRCWGGACATTLLNGVPTGGPSITELRFDRPDSDIAKVVFGGNLGVSRATRIGYASVPEPSTLMLLGLGGAVALVRRRRGSSRK